MTKLLQEAFDQASKLPEAEQDALGRIVLEELADQALAEHDAGRTEKLDPEKM